MGVLLAAKPVALSSKSQNCFLSDFFVGGSSGVIAKTVAAPIERVKLLIQTQDRIPDIASGNVPRYSGIRNCFVRVIREQGLPSLWRGNLPNVLRYFPTAAFNFSFNAAFEGLFPKYNPDTEFSYSLLVNLLSGGLAGAMSLTLVYPLDYCRTRLAGDIGGEFYMTDVLSGPQPLPRERQFKGLYDCLIKTVHAQGPFALYTGYMVSVVGIFVYRAPYFGIFNTLNPLNPFAYKTGDGWDAYLMNLVTAFFLAQASAAVAAFVSYPIDTVRRRLQMESDKPDNEKTYRNAFHCAHMICTSEGGGAMYNGFLANLFRGASTAFMLVIFDELTGAKNGH